jgi:hypothetical protein
MIPTLKRVVSGSISRYTPKQWFSFVVRLCLVGLLQAPASSFGGTFNVSTVSGLKASLAIALTNRQNDVISLAPGYYALDTKLSYDATLSGETNSLTIQCLGGGAEIDGGTISSGIMQALYIKTSGSGAHVTLDGLTIQNSRIYASEGPGAAMFVWLTRGNITLKNCVIKDNKANQFLGPPVNTGGAWLRTDNPPGGITVNNCVFTNNYSSGYAGGLYMTIGGGTTGRVFNCLFVGNSAASRGGGAYIKVVVGSAFVDNNTFLSNWTGNGDTGGGGLSLHTYLDSDTVIVRNNILWDNTSNTGLGSDLYVEDDGDYNGTGALITFYNNDVNDLDIQDGDHLTQGSNTNANPLLTSDYHLRAASPCIDTGTNLTWMSGATDIDAQPRIFNNRVDMGHDETFISAISITRTGTVSTVWNTVVDAKCQLWSCTNLAQGNWQSLGSMVTSTSSRITMNHTNQQDATRFYSLRWTRP